MYSKKVLLFQNYLAIFNKYKVIIDPKRNLLECVELGAC